MFRTFFEEWRQRPVGLGKRCRRGRRRRHGLRQRARTRLDFEHRFPIGERLAPHKALGQDFTHFVRQQPFLQLLFRERSNALAIIGIIPFGKLCLQLTRRIGHRIAPFIERVRRCFRLCFIYALGDDMTALLAGKAKYIFLYLLVRYNVFGLTLITYDVHESLTKMAHVRLITPPLILLYHNRTHYFKTFIGVVWPICRLFVCGRGYLLAQIRRASLAYAPWRIRLVYLLGRICL